MNSLNYWNVFLLLSYSPPILKWLCIFRMRASSYSRDSVWIFVEGTRLRQRERERERREREKIDHQTNFALLLKVSSSRSRSLAEKERRWRRKDDRMVKEEGSERERKNVIIINMERNHVPTDFDSKTEREERKIGREWFVLSFVPWQALCVIQKFSLVPWCHSFLFLG